VKHVLSLFKILKYGNGFRQSGLGDFVD